MDLKDRMMVLLFLQLRRISGIPMAMVHMHNADLVTLNAYCLLEQKLQNKLVPLNANSIGFTFISTAGENQGTTWPRAQPRIIHDLTARLIIIPQLIQLVRPALMPTLPDACVLCIPTNRRFIDETPIINHHQRIGPRNKPLDVKDQSSR